MGNLESVGFPSLCGLPVSPDVWRLLGNVGLGSAVSAYGGAVTFREDESAIGCERAAFAATRSHSWESWRYSSGLRYTHLSGINRAEFA